LASEIDNYSLDKFNQDKRNLLLEIKNNPHSYSLFFELGNTYVKIREFEKAISNFQKAIDLYKGEFYEEANQNLIAAYLDSSNYKMAITIATNYLIHNPTVQIVKEMKELAEEMSLNNLI